MPEESEPIDRWQRLRQLFDGAIALDDEQRDAWLDRECEGDGELRNTVDALLAASEDHLEIIDMAIQQASSRYLRSAGQRSHVSLTSRINPNRMRNQRMRRAFACIETFFRNSARARRNADPNRARADLELADAFGLAAVDTRGKISIDDLLDALQANGTHDETTAALRHWLDVLRTEDFCG